MDNRQMEAVEDCCGQQQYNDTVYSIKQGVAKEDYVDNTEIESDSIEVDQVWNVEHLSFECDEEETQYCSAASDDGLEQNSWQQEVVDGYKKNLRNVVNQKDLDILYGKDNVGTQHKDIRGDIMKRRRMLNLDIFELIALQARKQRPHLVRSNSREVQAFKQQAKKELRDLKQEQQIVQKTSASQHMSGVDCTDSEIEKKTKSFQSLQDDSNLILQDTRSHSSIPKSKLSQFSKISQTSVVKLQGNKCQVRKEVEDLFKDTSDEDMGITQGSSSKQRQSRYKQNRDFAQICFQNSMGSDLCIIKQNKEDDQSQNRQNTHSSESESRSKNNDEQNDKDSCSSNQKGQIEFENSNDDNQILGRIGNQGIFQLQKFCLERTSQNCQEEKEGKADRVDKPMSNIKLQDIFQRFIKETCCSERPQVDVEKEWSNFCRTYDWNELLDQCYQSESEVDVQATTTSFKQDWDKFVQDSEVLVIEKNTSRSSNSSVSCNTNCLQGDLNEKTSNKQEDNVDESHWLWLKDIVTNKEELIGDQVRSLINDSNQENSLRSAQELNTNTNCISDTHQTYWPFSNDGWGTEQIQSNEDIQKFDIEDTVLSSSKKLEHPYYNLLRNQVVPQRNYTTIVNRLFEKKIQKEQEFRKEIDQLEKMREQGLLEKDDSLVKQCLAQKRSIRLEAKMYKKKAAQEILTEVNRQTQTMDGIDLHGLLREEAIMKLKQYLYLVKEMVSCLGSSRAVLVITGKGNHSKNGIASMKQGVVSWLLKQGYKFQKETEGSYVVVIESISQ